MKPILDNFSALANIYATFRPHYPDELFEYLCGLVGEKDAAWDCGTGNGQVARKLADRFNHVFATDISQAQLTHAQRKENITYILTRAEHTTFADRTFDLITVAQAVHWFDFDAFYKEIRRVAKPGAVIAIWGYGSSTVTPEIDALVNDFYTNVVGKYWDPERRYVEQAYRTIPFPFRELPIPAFEMMERWSFEHFVGFLNSWSAVQNYVNAHKVNPVETLKDKLQPLWNAKELKRVSFPLFLRVGMIEAS